jgi:hypothetical protein
MIRKPISKRERTTFQTQTHRTANRLRQYFAPASMMPPPGITRGSTGNRNVALSSQASPNYSPNDQAIIKLHNGVAVWHFSTVFKNPPICHAIALGQQGTSVQEIYLQGIGTPTGQVFHSTDPTDQRYIHVHAAGNPA